MKTQTVEFIHPLSLALSLNLISLLLTFDFQPDISIYCTLVQFAIPFKCQFYQLSTRSVHNTKKRAQKVLKRYNGLSFCRASLKLHFSWIYVYLIISVLITAFTCEGSYHSLDETRNVTPSDSEV